MVSPGSSFFFSSRRTCEPPPVFFVSLYVERIVLEDAVFPVFFILLLHILDPDSFPSDSRSGTGRYSN